MLRQKSISFRLDRSQNTRWSKKAVLAIKWNFVNSTILIIIAVLGLFSSCNTRKSNVMSMREYLEVQPGMSEEKLRQSYGNPDFSTQKDDGLTIYVYIERFVVGGSRPVESRRYYYYIRNDKVIAKAVRYYNAPANEAFDEDEYNL